MNRIEESILRHSLVVNLEHHKTTTLCTAVGFTCTALFLFVVNGLSGILMTICCVCFAVLLFRDFIETKNHLKDVLEDEE